MARRKETIWQRDFSLGAVRPEAVERDDTPLIDQSVKEALNTISLTTGQTRDRPGTVHLNETDANHGIEVDLGQDLVFDLHIVPTGVILYDSDGAVEFSSTSGDWTTITGKYSTYTFDDIQFWVIPDPDGTAVLIGSRYFPTQALIRDSAGSWTFGEMAYTEDPGGAVRQPFWNYYPQITITPSARTGTITVTASSPIFTSAHAGLTIRYFEKQIEFTTFSSTTVMNATVLEKLPPAFTLTVSSSDGFAVGDAVEHSTDGGRGLVTAISGNDVTVVVLQNYTGFPNSGSLIGPTAKSAISARVSAAVQATELWDIQMGNPIHGYAGHASRHLGRVYLCDFPSAPQAFAVSVAAEVSNFKMGVNDADGFVETIGTDVGGTLKYVLSAEDLLFFTTKGLYYQGTRDGTAVTPQTIGPVRFSRFGCASVIPIAVDDGAVFVDAVGQQIHAAILAGDINRAWTRIPLTKFHSHLISTPVRLGATASGSATPEDFLYVTNSDGTATICQWDRDNQLISWRPWETQGQFKSIYQAFGEMHAVVDRTIATVATRFRERFETSAVMDCVAAVNVSTGFPEGEAGVAWAGGTTAFATHLEGHTATVYEEGWDHGDRVISAAGKPLDDAGAVLDYPDYQAVVQVGLPFDVEITPWSRRSASTQRGVREVKRLIALFVTVQSTGVFKIAGKSYGGYRVGENSEIPPPLRDQQYKVTVLGTDSYEDVPITRDRPGPFLLTKLGYRVVV